MNRFVEIISTSNLDLKDKIGILEYSADERLIRNDKLGYLEIKNVIWELKNAL